MYRGLHVKYPLFWLDFNEHLIFSDIFKKTLKHIKSHENPSSGSRVIPCGQTDGRTDGRTDGHDEANSLFSRFCEIAKSDGPS